MTSLAANGRVQSLNVGTRYVGQAPLLPTLRDQLCQVVLIISHTQRSLVRAGMTFQVGQRQIAKRGFLSLGLTGFGRVFAAANGGANLQSFLPCQGYGQVRIAANGQPPHTTLNPAFPYERLSAALYYAESKSRYDIIAEKSLTASRCCRTVDQGFCEVRHSV
jgi:hypothetical protein